MGYFPFFIDIGDKEILVVGGGTVALRKIEKLLPFEPRITVIAPRICDEILRFNVKTERRRFADGDTDGKFCVICATDDEEVNAHVYGICRARDIPINTVDDKEKCSFIFPALSGGEGVTVGISTSGKSPIYARFLRERIDDMLDGRTLETAEILGRYRPVIKRIFADEQTRKEVNGALLDLCLVGDALPDDKEINDMLERLRKSYENKDRNKRI